MKKSHVPSFSHFNMRNLSQPFAKRIAWSQNLSILPQETPCFRTVGIRIKQLCRGQASKLLPQKWPSENQETSKRGFTASREILFLEWVLPNVLKQIRFILSKRLWKFRNSRLEFCVSVGKKNEVYFGSQIYNHFVVFLQGQQRWWKNRSKFCIQFRYRQEVIDGLNQLLFLVNFRLGFPLFCSTRTGLAGV